MEQEKALAFVRKLANQYYEKQDMETVQLCLEERTSWIGTGEGEITRNRTEVREALLGALAEYSGSFAIADASLTYMPFADHGGIVYGTLRAVPADKTLSEEQIRLSAVLEETPDGPRLLHLHSSHADPTQEHGAFFVKQKNRDDNKSLRQQLNLRNLQLANLTQNIPGGAHQCANDPGLSLLSMSDGFLSMFGYTKEDVETQFDGKFLNMVYPGDRAEMIKTVYKQLQESSNIEAEYRVLRKHGQPIWVLDKGRLMDDGSGSCCFYCLLIDITERKLQEEELRLSLERHKVIMDQAEDIIFEWDIAKDTLEFSANWQKKFGYNAVDTKISGRIPLSQNIHKEDMPAFVKIMKDTAAGVPYSETEFRIRDSKGRYYWCRIRATAQYNADGLPIKAVGVIVDIDEEKKQKESLIAQAQHDALTGIYNKETIGVLVEQRMHGGGAPGFQALFILDVDHFKAVNDTYGHLCGDSILSDVAAALKGSTRSSDLVGRIGGDEFLVYLPEIVNEDAALQKAEHILKTVGCIQPEQNALPISCSIGVAVLPYGKTNYETLYQYADRALYRQKNNGRGGVTVWNAESWDAEPNPGAATTAVSNFIVSDEGNVTDEWLAQYAFRTLYETKSIEEALCRLLEILGRSFDVSRAYIFESSVDGTHCSNTFEWCGEGVDSQMDALQNLSYADDLDCYLHNFNEHGVFYCRDIGCLTPHLFAVLEPQGIRSMLQCTMLDEGKIVGYVGFDECRENRTWSDKQVATFKLTADVLSTFLIKLRQKQKNQSEDKE